MSIISAVFSVLLLQCQDYHSRYLDNVKIKKEVHYAFVGGTRKLNLESSKVIKKLILIE